jgi:hypothetical protein
MAASDSDDEGDHDDEADDIEYEDVTHRIRKVKPDGEKARWIRENVLNKPGAAYAALVPILEQIANTCTDLDSFNAASEMLKGVSQELLSRHAARSTAQGRGSTDNNNDRMVSTLEIDCRKTEKRLAPHGSPSKLKCRRTNRLEPYS